MVEEQIRIEGRRGGRCPLCHDLLDAGSEELFGCPACETRYHHACARELGGCATLGCASAGVPPPPPRGEPFVLPPERLAAIRNHIAGLEYERMIARSRPEPISLAAMGRVTLVGALALCGVWAWSNQLYVLIPVILFGILGAIFGVQRRRRWR